MPAVRRIAGVFALWLSLDLKIVAIFNKNPDTDIRVFEMFISPTNTTHIIMFPRVLATYLQSIIINILQTARYQSCLDVYIWIINFSFFLSSYLAEHTWFCQILSKIWMCLQTLVKIPRYDISKKSVRWEPRCCMRTDRRTVDMTRLVVAVRNCCTNAPKKTLHLSCAKCIYKYVFRMILTNTDYVSKKH